MGMVMVLAGYGSAHAFGNYLDTFNTQYPTSQFPNVNNVKNCGLCHLNAANPGARNAYGLAYASSRSFSGIENLDSDGDGFTNRAEITNNPPTYPGDAASKPAPVVVTCTSFTYSDFAACQSNNTQTRTVVSSSPAGCTGGSPVLTQSCTFVPPTNTCTSFTYSDFGTCQSNNTQTRTVVSSSPSGCTGGTPVLTQSCTFVPPAGGSTSVTVTAAEGTGQITVETLTGGTNLTNVTAISSSAGSIVQNGKPTGFAFNNGLVSFKLNAVATGGTAQVKITLPAAIPAGSKVYKTDATGFHEYSGATISGNAVTLTLTDGGNGDSDGAANGSITDPVGIASPVAVVSDDDDGGGCSMGGRSATATALADSAIMFSPLLIIAAARFLRRRKVETEK
ncbi:MAG: hypothetical protein C0402_00890 [Thermodesulfovibrio sp.]|nr:hypothetical protein [Thermodesulfovibrio sp.]